MTYIDALKIKDTIHVVERINGKRVFQKFPAKYVFYIKKNNGEYTSIYQDPLSKYESSNYRKFQKELSIYDESLIFESDINPVFRFLEDHYSGLDGPNLNICLFDIEVDFDPNKGFSSPDDPYGPINAITLHQSWTDQYYTLTVKPETLSWDEAADICDLFENTKLCISEEELFEEFFKLIDEADVISGWNSTTFDLPYMVRRLEKIKNRDATKQFCLWNQFPRKKTFEQYGKEQTTYELYGRVHLDYLDLYRKHTYHEMHSYSLDYVGQYEINEKKLAYQGSLDKLYRYDFKLFIEYNRQDTMILVKIDKKNKFISLSNNLAHENNVLLGTTLGSVALIEQAIVAEIHNKGFIVPSRKKVSSENKSVAGAFVANPIKGMHDWVGSIDINSLYPSVIRSLNMSPETIMGQIKCKRTQEVIDKRLSKNKTYSSADAWANFFGVLEYQDIINKNDALITIDLEDGSTVTQEAKDWYNVIFSSDSNICLSANGTLFRTDITGIIPGLLERWYNERLEIRKKASILYNESKKVKGAKKEELEKERAFLNQRQLIKKILLNSLYGALLNNYCRYFDQRLGQSVTLTGRCITKHMISKVNELITGEYDHEGKAIIAGDTDSVYFSAYPIFKNIDFDWTVENVISLYDNISDQANDTFTDFMISAFNTTKENGEIIQAGREVVAKKGLFIKKKRYALLCNDIEGERFDDPGYIKAMGIDLKRSDTPVVIQNFLKAVLEKLLLGEEKEKILEYVNDFRNEFKQWDGWKKGTPKRVNGLTQKVIMEEKFGKVNMAGHQRASKNWNTLRKMYSDNYSMEIQDGFKVIVCKLLNNPLKLTSIAYPIDQEHIPDWFKNLPFDHALMENALIDKKLQNLLGVLNWDLKSPENDLMFKSLFEQE